MPQSFRYPSLIKLNNDVLTDESRAPLSETRDERSTVVELASGKRRKFIKGVRKQWSITWDNVAMTSEFTVDGNGGRNEIRSLAQSGGELTLVIRDGRNADETYTVFVTDYKEDLVMRRPGDLQRYNLQLGLEEVG